MFFSASLFLFAKWIITSKIKIKHGLKEKSGLINCTINKHNNHLIGFDSIQLCSHPGKMFTSAVWRQKETCRSYAIFNNHSSWAYWVSKERHKTEGVRHHSYHSAIKEVKFQRTVQWRSVWTKLLCTIAKTITPGSRVKITPLLFYDNINILLILF